MPDAYLGDQPGHSPAVACVALYGCPTAADKAQTRVSSTSDQEGSVSCDWWARFCLQQDSAKARQALGGLVAPEEGGEAVTALLLSAAARRVSPAVVEGAVGLVARVSAVACALDALKMVASVTAARDWVWERRKEICEDVEQVRENVRKKNKGRGMNVWDDEQHFAAMGMKTVVRHLVKYLPRSPELGKAIQMSVNEEMGVSNARGLGDFIEGTVVEEPAELDAIPETLG